MTSLTALHDNSDDHRATHCLACGASVGHLPICPALTPGATDLLVEHIDATTRTWMVSGLRHNLTPARRARFTAQMPAMHWVRPVDRPKLPLSTGALVNDMLASLGIAPYVSAIGYSGVASVPVADCRCTDVWRCRCDFPDHPFREAPPDFWPDYALLAFKVRCRRAWSVMWWLDNGVGAVYIVEDYRPLPAEQPTPVTMRCLLDWCDTCRGEIGNQADGSITACQCRCH